MNPRNDLRAQQTRQGWVISDEHDPIAASLSYFDDSIELTLVSKYGEPESRWPEKLNPNTHLTSTIDFKYADDLGMVELVDCFPTGRSHSGPYLGVDKWVFQPAHLVFGGHGKTWRSVKTLDTYIPMLRRWMGTDAARVEWELNSENADTWLEIDLLGASSLPVHGHQDHLVILDSRTKAPIDSNGIHAFSTARVSTILDDSSERDVALSEHSALIDFLSIIYGFRVDYSSRYITSQENPVLDLGGNPISQDALIECKILSSKDLPHKMNQEMGTRPEALISYSRGDTKVFSRWLEFWSANQLGITALVRAIEEQQSWESKLLNTAVAFEEFGYKIPGNQEYRSTKQSFPTYLKRLCMDMPRIAMAYPEDWANRFNAAYKGIKHADNSPPDLTEIVLTTKQGIAFLRAWCCYKADKDNPILDPIWGRLINYEDFSPQTAKDRPSNAWCDSLPEAILLEECERMDKSIIPLPRFPDKA